MGSDFRGYALPSEIKTWAVKKTVALVVDGMVTPIATTVVFDVKPVKILIRGIVTSKELGNQNSALARELFGPIQGSREMWHDSEQRSAIG